MTETPVYDAAKALKDKPKNTLTAHDRCDTGCGSQAYVKVYFTADSDLLFCGHHWAEYRKKIGETYVIFDVVDETASINKAREKQ